LSWWPRAGRRRVESFGLTSCLGLGIKAGGFTMKNWESFFYGKKGLILPRMMGILTNESGETW
jgi:hypothetical protein